MDDLRPLPISFVESNGFISLRNHPTTLFISVRNRFANHRSDKKLRFKRSMFATYSLSAPSIWHSRDIVIKWEKDNGND